jgi:hypothetical protein
MSWIGRKIYQYLKECEEFKKDMCAGYQPNGRLDTSNPPTNELPNFKFTPPSPEPIFPSDEYIDERKTAPKTNITEFNSGSGKYVWFDENGIKYDVDLNKELVDLGMPHQPAPERVPFEHFKNNRKKMKKEIRHEETCIITSVENNGVVTITIEPKKGNKVYGVGLDVKTGEITKEPVLPKELLSPKPELQKQCDTYAKLLTTMDYYNRSASFSNGDIIYVFNPLEIHSDRIMIKPIVCHRLNYDTKKLFFKDEETAKKFLENFLHEIESVKHLI